MYVSCISSLHPRFAYRNETERCGIPLILTIAFATIPVSVPSAYIKTMAIL